MRRADLSGKQFGRLTATDYAGDRRWNCLCDCGAIVSVDTYQLTKGRTRSCGCFRSELMRTLRRKHGMSNGYEWHCYYGMLDRCYNQKSSGYKNYGGRGITVCDRWRESFENFLFDMGRRPDGCSIDRADVNGNYEPGNCTWATPYQQARNTTRTIRITLNGVEKCLADWASQAGIGYSTMYSRLRRGVPVELLMEPVS